MREGREIGWEGKEGKGRGARGREEGRGEGGAAQPFVKVPPPAGAPLPCPMVPAPLAITREPILFMIVLTAPAFWRLSYMHLADTLVLKFRKVCVISCLL